MVQAMMIDIIPFVVRFYQVGLQNDEEGVEGKAKVGNYYGTVSNQNPKIYGRRLRYRKES